TDFGESDPQFGLDCGFYAVDLPVLLMIVSSLSMLTIVALIMPLGGHYVLGGIPVGNQAAGVTSSLSRPARAQLAVTAGIWMLLKVGDYWLDRYELLYNSNDMFSGASYTDLNAQLPAKIILMVIGVFVAVAFFTAIVLK